MASNQLEPNGICPICLDCVSTADAVNVCSDKTHGPSCRVCITSYIENQVQSAYLGTCPCITCPNLSHVKSKSARNKDQQETEGNTAEPDGVGKKRKLLLFEEWKLMVPNSVQVKYTSLAQSILAFLCGGCHSLKSLDVGFDRTAAFNYFVTYYREHSGDSESSTGSVPPPPISEANITTSSETSIPPPPPADASTKPNLLTEDILRFCGGEMTVDELFTKIFSFYVPQLVSIADQPAWDIFINVLKLIPDPERRANFHLRYLRDRPRIKTACCNREHCFKCRIKDYHEGKSCTENIESLDHSVVSCPSCGISLTKGDGCNTITCVCGKQFSWTAEKENSERCQQFLTAFPTTTSSYCAVVLCTNFTHIRHPRSMYQLKNSSSPVFNDLRDGSSSATNSDSGRTVRRNVPVSSSVISQAKAWQLRHRVEVSREMRNLFETVHWPSPSQCCSTISAHLNPEYVREEGMKEAADIWKQENVKAVAKCAAQNSIALQSLMTTFYSNDSDRAVGAYKLLNLSRLVWKNNAQHPSLPFAADSRLVESAKQWVEKNREVYNTFVEMYEIRSAQQFLHLYGTRHPSYTRPSYTYIPSVSEWCRRTSNSDLTFTNDYTTVERVGSVSCYPAAFAPILADHCSFKVVLDVAPKTSNWISFGLARTGMANSSSDGVGRTSNTWGLSDDRSSSSSHCIISASNQESGTFRKLVAGDILTATVCLSEGMLEISVNDNELQHRFSIPPGNLDEYVFAMTFANDHRVSIVYENGPVPNKGAAASKETTSSSASSSSSSAEGESKASNPQCVDLNYEQTQMMNILRKQLKAILTQVNSDGTVKGSAMLLLDGAQKWEQLSGGSYEEAARNYQQISKDIELLLNIRRSSTAAEKQGLSELPWLTWNTIIWALSWYKENKERIQIEQNTVLAQDFYCMYGEDAAFMAAMNLVEYHTHRVDSDVEMSSLAFMKVFEADMQSWYEYNASLSEPLIENLNKRCKCLPRHNKKCPKEVRS